MNRRWIVRCTFVLLPFAMVGCSATDSGTVSGTVKVNNTAVPAGTVTFHGKEKANSGNIMSDGSYTVHEAPLGPCKVTVTTPGGSPLGIKDGKAAVDPVSGKAASNVTVPEIYTDMARTPLSFEVKPGKSSFPIEIK